ncbi:hypothetical protein [Pantoea leporis]|uniref:hypothetical protein n=1 Tax=Pantoea leporis TaxID=2933780 RepID=UPI002302C04E|nr:hypothetical protein [Pantoea leporis]
MSTIARGTDAAIIDGKMPSTRCRKRTEGIGSAGFNGAVSQRDITIAGLDPV